MGNIKPLRQGAAHSDEEHAAKRAAATEAFKGLVDKQMIWWKAAPDEHQPPPPAEDSKEVPTIIGDLWTTDGLHINGFMAKQGHVDRDTKYHSDLARNILTAESEERKKESYAELEKALKENQKEKLKAMEAHAKQQREEAKAKEKAEKEAIGVGGYAALGMVAVLVLAALCNFG